MKDGVRAKKPKARARKIPKVRPSSGNIFADLGIPRPEETLLRAKLAARICAILERRRLSQANAAVILKVDQPKMSALVRGKLDGFSTERLFRFLNALDQDIEIAIRPKSAHASAAVRVL